MRYVATLRITVASSTTSTSLRLTLTLRRTLRTDCAGSSFQGRSFLSIKPSKWSSNPTTPEPGRGSWDATSSSTKVSASVGQCLSRNVLGLRYRVLRWHPIHYATLNYTTLHDTILFYTYCSTLPYTSLSTLNYTKFTQLVTILQINALNHIELSDPTLHNTTLTTLLYHVPNYNRCCTKPP